MGCGRLQGFTANIFPFRDNPTVPVPVVFYSVPLTNPDGPESPFVDRFWDERENWYPLGIGTDPTSFKPYFGPVPPPTVGPLVGSADEWRNGLLYSTWVAGGYQSAAGCVTLPDLVTKGKAAQAQGIASKTPPQGGINQGQTTQSTYSLGVKVPCCSNLIPPFLRATVSGSDFADGTYTLTPGVSGGDFVWTYSGAFGSCPAGSVWLIVGCSHISHNWYLRLRRVFGAAYNLYAPASVSCLPLNLVFNCGSAFVECPGPDPYTVTITG